jgi:hypothetical protein
MVVTVELVTQHPASGKNPRSLVLSDLLMDFFDVVFTVPPCNLFVFNYQLYSISGSKHGATVFLHVF